VPTRSFTTAVAACRSICCMSIWRRLELDVVPVYVPTLNDLNMALLYSHVQQIKIRTGSPFSLHSRTCTGTKSTSSVGCTPQPAVMPPAAKGCLHVHSVDGAAGRRQPVIVLEGLGAFEYQVEHVTVGLGSRWCRHQARMLKRRLQYAARSHSGQKTCLPGFDPRNVLGDTTGLQADG
jgi:hypothetical protein